MGNVSDCCAHSNERGDGRCCTKTHVDRATGVPGSGRPLPSSEVLGIDKLDCPGVGSAVELGGTRPDTTAGEEAAFPTAGACPGGNHAAGSVEVSTTDYQTVTYEDKSTYTGQIVNGKREGQGLWQSANGQYDGQWVADVQHGNGRQTWNDGRVYDGSFQHGAFSGRGRMVWHTQQKGTLIYDGQYDKDLKHGAGKFVWADGRAYDGEWQRGKRHGRGIYTNARSEQKVGYWADDKFDRWEATSNEVATAHDVA